MFEVAKYVTVQTFAKKGTEGRAADTASKMKFSITDFFSRCD